MMRVRSGLWVLAFAMASGCGVAGELDAGMDGSTQGQDGALPDAGPPDGGGACGDESIDAPEECDDGNVEAGDGCSPSCRVELGYTCEGEPSICERRCESALECDDGLFCNGAEECVEGACAAGTPPAVDDAVACTDDRCDEDAGAILHVPSDAACDDSDACNGEERCTASGCAAGVSVDVDDGIACTTDACDPATGAVSHTPVDTACDDSSDCTRDACVAGVGCTMTFECECSSAADCDDANPCTDESCGADGACVYTNNSASCDDGLFCNGGDVCAAGSCTHAGDPCAAGAECADSCDEARDSCERPAGAGCTDDGNGCTDDVCSAGACTHPANTAPCNDGLFCNGADVCAAGSCTHAGDPCAAGGECADSCDEARDSCERPAGAVCTDDGNGCTDDVCSAGTCTHPANTVPCDDGLFCNGADVCAGGVCAHAGDPCAGGLVCNRTCDEPGDHCFTPAGVACPDDGLACTVDACDGSGTCTHVATGAESACGDGVDDDCDGAIDCVDPDCAGDACGPGAAVCVGTVCVCPGGSSEAATCTNGTDDDCDGAIDCADSDCTSSPACSCTRTRCTTSCAAPSTCLAGTCGRGGAYGWDRRWGGTGNDAALSIAATAAGYYVAGSFSGTSDFGGGARTAAGTDGVLVAYDGAGAYRWDRVIGDSLNDVAADAIGNVVVVGYVRTSSTLDDGIVRKISPANMVLWARSYGMDVIPLAVAVDSTGGVVVAGYFNGSVDFGGGMRTAGSGADIFVLALTSAGTWRWDRTFDAGTFDAAYAVATDAAGNVYVGGSFGSQIDFGGGPTASYAGGAFVVSFDGDGAYRWDESFGSTQPDAVTDLAVTQLDDLVIAGYFGSTVDFGGGPRTSAGAVDAVVWVLGTDGSYRWDRVYGASAGDDRVDGVDVDCAGNIAATGMFTGTVDFGGGARTAAGGRDVYVLSLSRTGAHRWDRRYGGALHDRGLGATFTNAGRVAVIGSFASSVDFGGGTRVSAGGTDAFVLELAD